MRKIYFAAGLIALAIGLPAFADEAPVLIREGESDRRTGRPTHDAGGSDRRQLLSRFDPRMRLGGYQAVSLSRKQGFRRNVSRINFAPNKINGIETHFQNAGIRQLCIYPYFVFVALRDIEPGA